MRAYLLLAIAVIASSAAPSSQSSSHLTVKNVVARAGRFAERQRDALTSVRADERYMQEIAFPDLNVTERRLLESEIAFVQLSDSAEWLAFRNVLRVDGVETGSDPARLEKLFRLGAVSEQGRRIAEENAVYNIGRLHRTLNIPTFVLHILMPQNSDRFKYRKAAERWLGADRVWELEYKERERPTIVRSLDGRAVPLEGRLWIVPEDGRLVRATLHASVPVTSDLEFEWRHDPGLDTWVPSEMRERYRRIPDEKSPPKSPRYYDIISRATYGNYRRFGVDVRIR
ncbi:MAG TPA: hypothetical protein VFJ02_08100 [Vicinamibacterales bacterium]|nr:hypothetical protein [Vicinamibacterales bacterium]